MQPRLPLPLPLQAAHPQNTSIPVLIPTQIHPLSPLSNLYPLTIPSLLLQTPNSSLPPLSHPILRCLWRPRRFLRPAPWQGASLKPLAASIATGIILWFVPVPSGVSRNAWQLLAIFLATIVGIITQPLPLGAVAPVALMGLGASVLTKTLTFSAAFSTFGDPIPWLIALAFFFARGFIKTGLGNRIAYQFV